MRLLTFMRNGTERLGVLSKDGTHVLCLPCVARHYGVDGIAATMLDAVRDHETALPAIKALFDRADADPERPKFFPLDQVTVLAPYKNPPRNIFCVGLNYSDHAREFDQAAAAANPAPQYPIIFTKPPTAIADPFAAVDGHEAETDSYDYETELAVIIGKGGKNITEEKAMEHVFGYSIINDLTARDVQKRGSQWFSGKCLDESAPFGPYIATKSDVPNPHVLDLEGRVNGELRQKSNTSRMIFSIPAIIAALSKGTTLLAGDIIATGTCQGVGMSFNPPKFLKKGDKIEMTIEGVGTLTNSIR